MTRRSSLFVDAAAIAAFAIVELALYRKVIRLWFTFDDPWILRLVTEHSAAAAFFDGSVWPQKLYTPLLMMAFEAQVALFGLHARPWYATQLVILFIAATSVFIAARTILPLLPSFLIALLFVIAAPMSVISTQLSTVHYLIAIALAGMAVSLWVAAVRRPSAILAIASAVVYFASMLAKEVSVPLPLLLVFLPVGDVRSRLRYTVAHCAVLIGYFALRRAVLGEFIGSYNFVIQPDERAALIFRLPFKIAETWGVTDFLAGLVLIAIVSATIIAAMRTRRAILLMIVAILITVGPLLPAAKEMHRRYGLLPWLGCSAAFAASLCTFRSRRTKVALAVVVALLGVVVNRHVWAAEFGSRQRMSDEARFFFSEMPADGLLRQPLTQGAVLRELNWLKKVRLGKQDVPSAFYDDFFLCVHDVDSKRVWTYDKAARAIVESTRQIPLIKTRYCSSIRFSAPLFAKFRFRQQGLHWEFGPYETGSYGVILGDGVEALPLARRDAQYLLQGGERFSLRVRYQSPEGWTTYSPELHFDFVTQPDVMWDRR